MPEAYRRVIYRIRFHRQTEYGSDCFLVLFGTQRQIQRFTANVEHLVPVKDDTVLIYIDKGEFTNMDPGQFPSHWENVEVTRPNAKNIGKPDG